MGRPRGFDKAQVLALVRDEFWAKGYEATSIDDLMRATGLGKGSLYAAFGDKHSLFLEVLEAYSAWRLQSVRAALQREGRAIDRLREFFSFDDTKHETRSVASVRGCLLVNSTTELGARDAAVRKLSRRTYGAVEDLLTDLIAQAVTERDLPDDTDARELGRLLLSVMQGMDFLSKTGMKPEELAGIGRATVARLLGDHARPAPRPRGRG